MHPQPSSGQPSHQWGVSQNGSVFFRLVSWKMGKRRCAVVRSSRFPHCPCSMYPAWQRTLSPHRRSAGLLGPFPEGCSPPKGTFVRLFLGPWLSTSGRGYPTDFLKRMSHCWGAGRFSFPFSFPSYLRCVPFVFRIDPLILSALYILSALAWGRICECTAPSQ